MIKQRIHLLLSGLLLLTHQVMADNSQLAPDFTDELLTPYLSIHDALAADDLEAAKAGASAFLKAIDTAPKDAALPGQLDQLTKPARELSEATDIKSARAAFLTLSDKLIPLVKKSGSSRHGSLYLAHCPMANGGKGGDWIQTDEAVENPYYGKMMLRCGSTKAISGK